MLATQENLNCLFETIRPDVLRFFSDNGHDTSRGNYGSIANNWWQIVHSPAAQAASPQDPATKFDKLESYIEAVGCSSPGVTLPLPPNTSPSPSGPINGQNNPTDKGGTVTGAPATPKKETLQDLVKFMQDHPYYVGLAAGLVFLILYKPPSVTFER